MNSTQLIRTGFLIALFLFTCSGLQAGWVLTGRYIDQDGKIILQRFFFEGNQVKFEQYNIIYTFNLQSNAIILVDPVNLVYYQGTIHSYVEGLQKLKRKQLDTLLQEIPSDLKEEYRRRYLVEISRIGQEILPVSDSVNVSRMTDTLKIGGQSTEKYLVSLNNRRIEETWVAPGLNIGKQFNWQQYLYFLSVLEPENSTLEYMVTAPYQELLAKGFPVRRIMIRGGFRLEFQVNRFEEKSIPAFEFYSPALCKELTFEQWVARNIDKEILYDDYE